ncbi:polynucleotide kinase [Streptomyces phage Beuffert]|nr:polynucleotide kinase [Streptomyces phage Beuffert]
MLELVINRGIPGSGKSTYAEAWVSSANGRVRSNRDDIRLSGYGVEFGPPIDEKVVTEIQHAGIRAALSAGVSVIVDDCNIEQKYINVLARIGYDYGAEVSINLVDVPVAVALERNRIRKDHGGRFVPENVIVSMHSRLQGLKKVSLPERIVFQKYNGYDKNPEAVMVDIDGTLAKMTKRGPFDWLRVGEDEPIERVIEIVNLYWSAGKKIVVMSGRDSVCREQTIEWLDKHFVPWDALFMRPEKDMRKDSIVKHELFWAHVAPFYNIQTVLDDRKQVVDMWREIGLTCFQVAPGDF